MAGPVFHLETPCPTVLLRHETSEPSSHFDWMIAREPAGHQRLVTFRLARRLDELQPGQELVAEHIGDHRPAYLTYEGPLSDDRGHVRRVAEGTITGFAEDDEGYRLEVRWTQECFQAVKLRRPCGAEPWLIVVGAARGKPGGGEPSSGRLGSY